MPRARLPELFRGRDIRYLLIASRGSSSNVARYAQYLLGRAHRVPVMFATPSLYTIYGQPPRLDGALVIGISQSGASPDVVAVLAEAREQGRPTLALTNDVESPLAQTAEVVLPLEAGERAGGRRDEDLRQLARRRGAALRGDGRRRGRAGGARRGCPTRSRRRSSSRSTTPPPLEEYRDAVGLTVVARGVNYGTGFEIALKIRELSGLVTEAYSPADLMHGPIAAIQPGWPVVVVAPSGPARPSVEEIVPPLRARGARLVAVSDVRAVLRRAQTKLAARAGRARVAEPADRRGARAGRRRMRLTQPARPRPRQPGRAAQGDADSLGARERRSGRAPRSRPPRVVLSD